MIKHTIRVGEWFSRIVKENAKITLDCSGVEGKTYIKCCRTTGISKLPDAIFPGDTIEMPSKSGWKAIKKAAGL